MMFFLFKEKPFLDKTNYLWSFFEAGELGWRDRVNERVSVCVRESVCVCVRVR